jgi:hypothetical protein
LKGFIAEVMVLGDPKWSRNSEIWPDAESADKAGYNLMSRWFLVKEYRVTEVDGPPNRPTWDEYVAERGLPPERVTL